MAPYLFFLGCGTYDTYTRTLEYPDGDCISLELLVFPGLVQPDHAVVAVNALHDSVMWTLLSTGPEATEHGAERKRVYELISERERLKSQLWGAQVRSNTIPTPVSAAPPGDHPALSQLRILRGELKSLMAAWTVTGCGCWCPRSGNVALTSSRLFSADTSTPGQCIVKLVIIALYWCD
jgi:aminopeptidase N